MATRTQITANRENARRSAGPRTPDGKAASSRNVIKHGFNCRHLFEQALLAAWILKRVARMEAEAYRQYAERQARQFGELRK